MKTLISVLLFGTLLASGLPAIAAQDTAQPSDQTTAVQRSNQPDQMLTQVQSGLPVSDYYKQNIYDTNDNKISDVKDLILEKGGKVNAAIIGVGGFLGAGEKDVAVPFDQLQLKEKNGDRYLVINTNKEALNSAPGLKFDRDKHVWIPENQSRG